MVVAPNEINSVVRQLPLDGLGWAGAGDAVLWLAHVADDIPAWGTDRRSRDIKLREFYKNEPWLSSAVYTVAVKRASYKWVLHGPKRQVDIVHRILHSSQHGQGWEALMIPVIKDELTTDNGAFIETIHSERGNPASPVVQLNHLDSGRCIRTGNWETPVIYQDIQGGYHQLKWYEVVYSSEYPDPDERMRGYQQCAVSRLLMRAQTMRSYGIFEDEKVSGRNPSSVHLVGGVQQQRIENILKMRQDTASNQGYLRYMPTPIIAALDPTARVSSVQIDLKGVPEGYDPEKNIRWYTLLLALALGVDPQEIAPLPGGNLGSAQQSQVLRESGRGKGNALFMSRMQHIMNFHGIIPQTVQFSYEDQDLAEDAERTQLKWRRAQMYRLLSDSPTSTEIVPPAIIRQMMRDNGDLPEEYLEAMNEPDLTPFIDRVSDEKSATKTATKSFLDRILRR